MSLIQKTGGWRKWTRTPLCYLSRWSIFSQMTFIVLVAGFILKMGYDVCFSSTWKFRTSCTHMIKEVSACHESQKGSVYYHSDNLQLICLRRCVPTWELPTAGGLKWAHDYTCGSLVVSLLLLSSVLLKKTRLVYILPHTPTRDL